jgi:hypothetical protein
MSAKTQNLQALLIDKCFAPMWKTKRGWALQCEQDLPKHFARLSEIIKGDPPYGRKTVSSLHFDAKMTRSTFGGFMSTVIYKKLTSSTAREVSAKVGTLQRSKPIRSNNTKKVAVISANEGTFGDDLTLAFGKNVSAARRENKKTFGMNDRVPVKA